MPINAKKRNHPQHRRYWLLNKALKSPDNRVTIAGLAKDKSFKRTFGDVPPATLKDDFRDLSRFGLVQIVREGDAGLVVSSNEPGVPLLDGYFTTVPEGNEEAAGKRRIARHIVQEHLSDKGEVIYLSTGTHVFQTAVAMLESSKRPAAILSDNFPVISLIAFRACTDVRLRQMRLHILGGKYDFDHGDLVADAVDVGNWQCSTAVISATGIDSVSGVIYSIRQPAMKKKILDQMPLRKVIIPVLPAKFEAGGGEEIIRQNRSDGGRKYFIVTTKIGDEIKSQLAEKGFIVEETGL